MQNKDKSKNKNLDNTSRLIEAPAVCFSPLLTQNRPLIATCLAPGGTHAR